MFIDIARIYVKAGDGGKGCNSLYRDKYMRYPRPDGGDGGKGADVIFKADHNLSTLYDFKFRQHFVAKNGLHGSGNNRQGRNAEDLVIKVPVGTIIRDAQTSFLIRDLSVDGDSVVVARGGAGGRGNQHKRDVTERKTGQELHLILDLKIIADVGLVGFPNAGKSTIISKLTNAHPKIAAYPFTTRYPILGRLKIDDGYIIIADIPGIIENSHEGKGLGFDFLRHIERTRLLVHVIDMAGVDTRDPVGDYKVINKELTLFNKTLIKKPIILVANKMDLPEAKKNIARFKKVVKKKILEISALESEDLGVLKDEIQKRLQKNSC